MSDILQATFVASFDAVSALQATANAPATAPASAVAPAPPQVSQILGCENCQH